MYNNRMRSLEIPENLFSNLGVGNFNNKKNQFIPTDENKEFYSSKSENELNLVNYSKPENELNLANYSKPESEFKLVNYSKPENELKLVNYSLKNEYRDRINRMYDEINIKPIDGEIKDVIYFNNYVEKGIVIKPKVSSLKQFWTEYRLINNEKIVDINKNEIREFSSFDELFDALSIRITEINKYIDELKEMKANIIVTTNKLAEDKERLNEDKEKFNNERIAFNNYREEEENKLKEEKKNLKINFSKLQTIIDDLDKKLGNLDN